MMTPTPPTLAQEARSFFQAREEAEHAAYQERVKNLTLDYSDTGWFAAADMRRDWRQAYADWSRALAAVPCTHRLAERSHEAQRCEFCWMLSTYSRLSTPKENDNDED